MSCSRCKCVRNAVSQAHTPATQRCPSVIIEESQLNCRCTTSHKRRAGPVPVTLALVDARINHTCKRHLPAFVLRPRLSVKMAATEEVPAEAPEAVAAAPVFDDSYDESLLIKVKGKVKRPVRPDDTERNLQIDKLQEQIDKASGRVKEIKEILDSRSTGKGVVNPQQQAIRNRLQQLRAEFDAVVVGIIASSAKYHCSPCHRLLSLPTRHSARPSARVRVRVLLITACYLLRSSPPPANNRAIRLSFYVPAASEETLAESERRQEDPARQALCGAAQYQGHHSRAVQPAGGCV